MKQEIERKFLVDGDYRPLVYKSIHIVQGYLNTAPGKTVRVRTKGGKGYLTIKGKANANRNPQDGSISGFARFEWEKEIALSEAEDLLRLCGDEVIDKTRHLVEYGGHIIEIDEFHGLNDGLTVAEIELEREDEPFEKPSWLSEEVTDDPRYYNSALLGNPYCRWKK